VFFRRVTLFHCFGFPVRADGSWLFLSVLICWTLINKHFPVIYAGHSPQVYQWMGFAAICGIFASIIAHEVAHAIVAEHYQMPIESITLFIFGGVAVMKGDPSSPKGEFLMAIAGPIMSVIMGLLFWAAKLGVVFYFPTAVAAWQVLGYLAGLNLVIAVFNMVPAFPLDGGRALRALIWKKKDNLVLGTRIASELGAIFAYGLLVYACFRIVMHSDLLGGMWLGLLGYFVHGAGAYAVRQTESRSLLGSETVSRFMNRQVIAVSPDLTITDLVDNYVYKHYQRSFPVVDGDELVGLISLQSILSLDRHKWHWLHVASVMEPLNDKNVVGPDYNAADALDVMQRLQKEQLLVADGKKFMGVISHRDLAAYLSITLKIDSNKPVITSRTA
jgi:Zn-dependent protease/predicted transcriptional regulator